MYLPGRNKADFSILTKFLVITHKVTDYTAGPHVQDLLAYRGLNWQPAKQPPLSPAAAAAPPAKQPHLLLSALDSHPWSPHRGSHPHATAPTKLHPRKLKSQLWTAHLLIKFQEHVFYSNQQELTDSVVSKLSIHNSLSQRELRKDGQPAPDVGPRLRNFKCSFYYTSFQPCQEVEHSYFMDKEKVPAQILLLTFTGKAAPRSRIICWSTPRMQ